MSPHKQRLNRLPDEFYEGYAWVHWTLTIEERQTGWLDAKFLYKFREIMTHVAFRYRIACPIYCLMPDHIHVLWCGLTVEADQRAGMQRLRTDANFCLRRIGFEFQRQPYDHVLQDKELEHGAIEGLINYIARNPERKGLVPVDAFAQYPFTGCLIPGYPNIRLFERDVWDSVWRAIAFLKRTKCFQIEDPKRARDEPNSD